MSFSTFCKADPNWLNNENRLCGFPPFYEENNTKLFEMIKTCNYEFPSPFWDDVSDTAKDLIRSILVVDPSKRLTAEQILAHPWVYGEGTPVNVLENVKENMRQYNIKRKFKVRVTPLSLTCYSFIENYIHGARSAQIQKHHQGKVRKTNARNTKKNPATNQRN